MRWEFFGQAINALHNETVARESNPSTAFWDTSLPLSDRTVPQVAQVYTNFEPRIGLAWNPDFDKKLVVSAGYAINANPSFYNILLLVGDGAPVTNLGDFLCGANACVPSNGSILSRTSARSTCPPCPPAEIRARISRIPSHPTSARPMCKPGPSAFNIKSATPLWEKFATSAQRPPTTSSRSMPILSCCRWSRPFRDFYPGFRFASNPAADGYRTPQLQLLESHRDCQRRLGRIQRVWS